MDEDTLFADEQETIAEGSALLAEEEYQNVSWRFHYTELLRKYRKLVAQTKRLVRMGDAMQKDLLRAGEIMEFQATHDFLTGLMNRAAIMETLAKELARRKREKGPLALIMADIDLFKHVNDLYGHMAGDAVLREASKRIESHVRPYDSVGRIGGEEFLIVVPGCSAPDAGAMAERLRAAFCDAPMVTSDGELHVTLSLGVAAVDSEDETDADSMIRAADKALYKAKRGGRNKVEVFSGDHEEA
jgi:diguanylate cyclase (GGDEF)-like protein